MSWHFVELFGLCGLAFAQPAFDYVAGSTTWIIAIQATWLDVALFALLALVVPPALAIAVEVVLSATLPSRLKSLVHPLIIGVLVAILANEWLKSTAMPVRFRLLIAAVAGPVTALSRARWRGVRAWLRALALAPLCYAGLFLAAPGVASLAVATPGESSNLESAAGVQRVVVVAFDELPLTSLLDGSGQIDKSLFPAFARLAGDSTWYRNSTTVADHTLRAFPALLASKTPQEKHVPIPSARNFPDNLFTMLSGNYEMNVHEAHEALCPVHVCGRSNAYPTQSGLRALLTIGQRAASAKAALRSDNRASISDVISPPSKQRAQRFVDSLARSRRPRLDYVHIMMPHRPWDVVGRRQLAASRPTPRYGAWRSEIEAEAAKQRHLLALQAADTTLASIVARLKELRIYDDALLVVTADHGIAFVPKQSDRVATRRNYPGIVWTPLFIKSPGQRRHAVSDQPVSTVDILPTILDEVGVAPRVPLDGKSVYARPASPSTGVRVATTDEGGPHTTRTFDRSAGFSAVLRARSWPGSANDGLRLFRITPYSALLNQPLAGTTIASDNTNRATKIIVDRTAKQRRILSIHGMPGSAESRYVAVTVNDTFAGFGLVEHLGLRGGPSVDVTLNPRSFTPGRNVIRIYAIDGDPASPTLTPTTLR